MKLNTFMMLMHGSRQQFKPFDGNHEVKRNHCCWDRAENKQQPNEPGKLICFRSIPLYYKHQTSDR